LSRPSYRVLAKGVVRDGDAVVHIASSTTYPIADPPPDLSVGRLPVTAYRLTPRESGVDIEHVVQIVTIQPTFANRLILSEEARAPRKLASVIEEQGFSPFFVRWSDGAVRLAGNDGDLLLKTTTFQFQRSPGRTKTGGPQLAWFEWSPKMFPKGVELRLEPASVAKVSRVEDAKSKTLLEFEWRPEELGEQEATLSLMPGTGIKLNGQEIVETVAKGRFDEVQKTSDTTVERPSEVVEALPAPAPSAPAPAPADESGTTAPQEKGEKADGEVPTDEKPKQQVCFGMFFFVFHGLILNLTFAPFYCIRQMLSRQLLKTRKNSRLLSPQTLLRKMCLIRHFWRSREKGQRRLSSSLLLAFVLVC
jgi:hypothetical protein